MKIILKTLKYLAYSILGLVAFLLLYLLSAVILSRIEVNAKEVSTEERPFGYSPMEPIRILSCL